MKFVISRKRYPEACDTCGQDILPGELYARTLRRANQVECKTQTIKTFNAASLGFGGYGPHRHIMIHKSCGHPGSSGRVLWVEEETTT